MRFKELSENDKVFIANIYQDKSILWNKRLNILADKYDVDERNMRKWIKKLGLSKQEVTNSEQYLEAKKKKHNKKQYYIITWAQNDTEVHKELLQNIIAYSEFLDAEVLVIAGIYNNPRSLESSKNLKNKVSWDSSVLPYLDANRHNIHKYLMVLSDIRVMPTAYNPLSGFEGVSGLESSLIGHPKQVLTPIPILDGHPHKILMTTGAVTKPNYTQTKAGAKGEFDHVLGFAIVEIRDSENFHIRNVSASLDGEFNDLFNNVKDGEVTRNKSLEGVVLGDLHCGSEDEEVMIETFKFMDKLKPKKVVLHDVFDGYSISHHHDKMPFLRYQKALSGRDVLIDEINYMTKYLSNFEKYEDVIIVRSNHDSHVDKYLNEKDWKKDIVNSKTYMEFSLAIMNGEANNGIIPYIIKKEYPEFTCLDEGESYMIKKIESGMHGDRGSNGARGTSTGFRKLPVKNIVGHSHSPKIDGGSYTVGTSTLLRLEYNKGLSSWMNSHCTIDNLGKRQLLLFVNGKFTTLK